VAARASTGVRLCDLCKDEPDAIRWAQEYLDEHPELDIEGGREGMTVCAGRVLDRSDGKETVFYANEN